MTRALRDFYDARARSGDPLDFLRQVGHTEGGQPISEDALQAMVDQIAERLGLAAGDRLLDLCCGNGVVTARLAARVARVEGVDLSPGLIAVADAHHARTNTRYHVGDVLDLGSVAGLGNGFTKVLMHAALQHLAEKDFDTLLDQISRVAAAECTMLFSHVLDRGLIWRFHDTPRRKMDYLLRRLSGRERMGTWWRKETIAAACASRGLRCDFLPIDPGLRASRYRFDVRIVAGR